ncbi:MAG: hypothetical protein COU27_02530 [Candidatus Levybacteria bacterium CG10_big_fil_rev_8_21_14_0_10_36_7]|nr:MAG: hypothetical protein COU27_02530 [Candidatus Levybacteria bacterium CG10_big_fil_rev_8_21_14_0_10_36_7]
MSFSEYFEFVKRLILLIPFNFFDYILFLTFLIYVYEEAYSGVTNASIRLLSILAAFFSGLLFYPLFSQLLITKLNFTKGASDATSFLVLGILSYFVISRFLYAIEDKLTKVHFPTKINILGGAFFGAASLFFLAAFTTSILLSFPVSLPINQLIKNSFSGKFLLSSTQGVEGDIKRIFGGSVSETINFLTIESNESSIALNFKYSTPTVDVASEKKMLNSINEQRRRNGLESFTNDIDLSRAARFHAVDMLKNGYFSHFTLDGLSPFDRLDSFRIVYSFAGENIAFAPNVAIAMNGLMKSPGHRDNILSSDFRKVGVGVLDAGVFGKMFVQEFSD